MQTERNEIGPGPGRRARPRSLWQTILVLALVAGAYWVTRDRQPMPDEPAAERPTIEHPKTERPAGQSTSPDRIEISGKPQIGKPRAEPPRADAPQAGGTDAEATFQIPSVVVRDRDGQVAWRGTVDLTQTIARIEADERLRFANDGSVFQNRERRLPRKNSGYYHEYVHPTPGLSGPGPQRVIFGAGGEIYYSADHYRTFTTIRGP